MKQLIKAYLSLNFSLVPLKPKGKIPLIAWESFQRVRASEELIMKWLQEYPDMNIGVVTGEISGIIVLDLDSEDSIEIAKSKGCLNTPLVKTSRGAHAYFKYSTGIRTAQKLDLLPSTQIKSDGGIIVLPPSIHPSGFQYSWYPQQNLFEMEPASFPASILSNKSSPFQRILQGVPEGERTISATSIIGGLINQGYPKDAVLKKMLDWNVKCRPPLTETTIEQIVVNIWEKHFRNPLAGDDSSGEEIISVNTIAFTPVPSGTYLLELLDIYSDTGHFGKRLNFIFKVLKSTQEDGAFAGAQLRAFLPYPKQSSVHHTSKLIKWASVLLDKNFDSPQKLNLKELVGRTCIGEVILEARTNRINNLMPVT